MACTSVLSTLNLLSSPAMQELEREAGKPLVAHASGLDDVPGKIDRIRSILVTILPLLSYADRYLHDPSVEQWVETVRSLAHQVEDILENHMYDSFAGVGGGLLRVVHGIGHASDKWKSYCRTSILLDSLLPMANEILDVYNLVIIGKLKGLAVIPASLSGRSFGRKKSWEPFSTEEEGPSIGKDKLEQIKRWVADEVQEKNMVIAVWGEGGVGKTTIVKEIYNNPQVVRQFECRAWLTISRHGCFRDLVRGLTVQLNGEEEDPCRGIRYSSRMGDEEESIREESEMLDEIRRMLRGKRYLMVFDDLQEQDCNLWDKMEELLLGQDHGRILTTTRDKDVAHTLAKEGRVMAVEPLSEEEAWRLFSKRVMWLDPSPNFPRELEESGRQVVAQCRGLPIATLAAANLMASKERAKSVWERVCRVLDLKLHDCPSRNILMQSYHELPSHLKPCFLYFGIFPEGCPLRRKLLVRLWVAEGFVIPEKDKAMEQVAEAYLHELVRRSMVEVVERNESGRVKACRIHDIFRTLALELSQQQQFATFRDEETRMPHADARRLPLEKAVVDGESCFNYSRLRSMVVFIRGGTRRLEFPFSSKLKLLKVLELRGVAITDVPEWIFTLYNLRYLGLRETKISVDVFPREIQQLQQLQTLDIWKTEVLQLPRNLVKLKNLRHLLYCGANAGDLRYRNPLWFRGREAPKGIWDMRNLQTLKTVEATDELVRRLGELTQLKTLSITKVMHGHYLPLLDSIGKMGQLQHLAIKVATSKVIPLDNLRVAPIGLTKLLLKGCFFCAPGWFGELKNLTHLYLFQSCARESPLETIGMLPSLSLLVMDGAYTGENLVFGSKWFPRLGKLCVDDMEVRSVVVEKEALPSLRKLYVSRCGSLGRDWQGLENLTTLEEIYLREPTTELWDFLQLFCRKQSVNLKEIR